MNTGTITIEKAIGTVFELLADYDGYGKWAPGLSKSKLLARENDLALAEFSQASNGGVFVVECIHERPSFILHRKISGNSSVAKCEWNLSALSPAACSIELSIQSDSGWRNMLPARRRLADPDLWLSGLRAHAEAGVAGRRSATAGAAARADREELGEPILRIVETTVGLEAEYRGRRYEMRPLDRGQEPR